MSQLFYRYLPFFSKVKKIKGVRKKLSKGLVASRPIIPHRRIICKRKLAHFPSRFFNPMNLGNISSFEHGCHDGLCCTSFSVVLAAALSVVMIIMGWHSHAGKSVSTERSKQDVAERQKSTARVNRQKLKLNSATTDVREVLPCIRKRRSVFPKDYIQQDVPPHVMQSLLDAAFSSAPSWQSTS